MFDIMASLQRKQRAALGKGKSDFFVWTDCEVELLLIVTNEYKVSKYVENVDWESCQTKYGDILDLYKQQYPSTDDCEPVDEDYPHKLEEITKTILTTKLKAIRHKYRQSLESGSRRAHGRVVLLYYDLCEQIWGASAATTMIAGGAETCRKEDRVDQDCSVHLRQYSVPSLAPALEPGRLDQAGGGGLSAVVDPGHRKERLKRKLPSDRQLVALAQEDLKIKKEILEQMEATNKAFTDSITKLASNIEKLTNTVAEGFAMMRQMLVHPPYSSPPPYSYGHTESKMAPPTSTPAAQLNAGHRSCIQSLFSDKGHNEH